MGRALSLPLRSQIVAQKQEGKTLVAIASELQLSYATVGTIYRRFKEKGVEGLAACYQRCGRVATKSEDFMRRTSVWLRRLHRSWGAAFICLLLQQRYKEHKVPCERTLQRWFKAAGLARLKSRLAVGPSTRAAQVHDVWQVDAKEKLQLTSGGKACYLTMVDEHSGALLKAWVFPPLSAPSGGGLRLTGSPGANL
jgi:transposase